ncbi:hypothetical protein L596_017667 [Steinernema carpocapsae]|uniref:Uncharacterized protein n=1 Tax=Steinernema carpocapsae TaxID=34508 RepID=A0A4U5N2D0_STECR|nr:hypothetical protein L596_017667 [Steinernema carpocapsae]
MEISSFERRRFVATLTFVTPYFPNKSFVPLMSSSHCLPRPSLPDLELCTESSPSQGEVNISTTISPLISFPCGICCQKPSSVLKTRSRLSEG